MSNQTNIDASTKDTERALLGALLVSPDLCAHAEVSGSDFLSASHGDIFAAILHLKDSGQDVSLVSVKRRLATLGVLEAMPGGVAALAALVEGVPALSASVVASLSEVVREASRARRLRSLLAAELERPAERAVESIERLEAGLAALSDEARSSKDPGPVHVSALARDVTEDIERIALAKGLTGVPTGFSELDDLTGGWQPGSLIVLAARPSQGKTSLALQFAAAAPTVFFSLEMSRRSIMRRLFSLRSRVSHRRIGLGLTEREWGAIAAAYGEITSLPLWIDDNGRMTVRRLVARARRHRAKLVVIDYLQLLSGERGKVSRHEEISQISRDLKLAAKELNLPVIALSQLSRAPEGRKDRRPMLSDLRESGAIEQDADVVLAIYREAMYNRTEENIHKAELICLKQRDGAIGTIPMHFDPSLTTFSEPKEEDL